MHSNDAWLLFAGGAFGLLLALFVQPLLEDRAQGLLVRIIGGFSIQRKQSLAGKWASVMLKDGVTLSRENEIQNIELVDVRNRIAGTFIWKERTYRLLAKRYTHLFVTGTYEDVRAGYTFHGAFQLRIYPNEKVMVGRWMGFNSDDKIIEGPWEWRRNEQKEYLFEKKNQSA